MKNRIPTQPPKQQQQQNSFIWSVVLFYSVSTLFGSFNAELNFKQFSLV